MLAAQASGAQIEPFWLTVYQNGSRMNIRHPAAVGMPLGMTYIMTELGCFPTQFALQYLCPL
jgi:hypothetical protein